MQLPRFSLGIGDRFGRQGRAQLKAFVRAKDLGLAVSPVWNKSFREHKTIGSHPEDVRREADEAVAALQWKEPYFVDADHIQSKTVDAFLAPSDFFTIDVADSIGRAPAPDDGKAFTDRLSRRLFAPLDIPGLSQPLAVSREQIEAVTARYLNPIREAGRIYRHIEAAKGKRNFITEVSMDETDQPQSPRELLIILAAAADEGLPLQTIAPKFSGRFNKGVEFVGSAEVFEREFEEDLCVIEFMTREFGLPKDLKLSVHSGSDKFALYPAIQRVLRRKGASLHVKTAGTTWLEELTGLAASGKPGLDMAKAIFSEATGRYEELVGPYATVIDIDKASLPTITTLASWTSEQFVAAVSHNQSNPDYNPSLRQLLHVGYKLAAEKGQDFLRLLDEHQESIGARVTENLLDRHLKCIFPKEEPL